MSAREVLAVNPSSDDMSVPDPGAVAYPTELAATPPAKSPPEIVIAELDLARVKLFPAVPIW